MPWERLALGVPMRKCIMGQRSALLGANYVCLHESSHAVGMADPPEMIDHATETFQESLSIRVIEEDVSRSESSARAPRNWRLRVPKVASHRRLARIHAKGRV